MTTHDWTYEERVDRLEATAARVASEVERAAAALEDLVRRERAVVLRLEAVLEQMDRSRDPVS